MVSPASSVPWKTGAGFAVGRSALPELGSCSLLWCDSTEPPAWVWHHVPRGAMSSLAPGGGSLMPPWPRARPCAASSSEQGHAGGLHVTPSPSWHSRPAELGTPVRSFPRAQKAWGGDSRVTPPCPADTQVLAWRKEALRTARICPWSWRLGAPGLVRPHSTAGTSAPGLRGSTLSGLPLGHLPLTAGSVRIGGVGCGNGNVLAPARNLCPQSWAQLGQGLEPEPAHPAAGSVGSG